MVDIVKVIDAKRQMMVRDTGIDIEFWIWHDPSLVGEQNSILIGGRPDGVLYQPLPDALYQTDGYLVFTAPPNGGWNRVFAAFNVRVTHNLTYSVGFPHSQHPGYFDYANIQTRILRGVGPNGIVQHAVRVFQNGAPKIAIAYVNVGGTWKPAEPWCKHQGVWRLGS